MISYFVCGTMERVYDPRNSKYADCRIEAHCLSTDEKPVGVLRNADLLIEMDKTYDDEGNLVNKMYEYDEENAIYRKM